VLPVGTLSAGNHSTKKVKIMLDKPIEIVYYIHINNWEQHPEGERR
jgi:hypothetical protein